MTGQARLARLGYTRIVAEHQLRWDIHPELTFWKKPKSSLTSRYALFLDYPPTQPIIPPDGSKQIVNTENKQNSANNFQWHEQNY